MSGEAKALNLICDVADYERVFELADHQLNKRLGNNPTHISVDATDSGRTPETILALYTRIMKQEAVSADAVPWLWLTLFDIPQLERVESLAEAEVRKAEELERARTVIQNLKRLQHQYAVSTRERRSVDRHLERFRSRLARREGIP